MALSLEIYEREEGKPGKVLVILIHGLGAPETTWISENVTWKDLFLSDDRLKCIDIGIVKYDTAHFASSVLRKMGVHNIIIGSECSLSVDNGPFTDIKVLAHELKRELSFQKLEVYDDIFIIGHSMGGLIGIRYILEEIENSESLKVSGFISLATPYNGSSIAMLQLLVKSIHKHAQLPSLQPNSIFLDDTIRLWQRNIEKMNVDCIFCYGTHDTIVPPESAVPHVVGSKWNGSIALPGDHSSIIKVEDHNSKSYAVVSDLIIKKLSSDVSQKIYLKVNSKYCIEQSDVELELMIIDIKEKLNLLHIELEPENKLISEIRALSTKNDRSELETKTLILSKEKYNKYQIAKKYLVKLFEFLFTNEWINATLRNRTDYIEVMKRSVKRAFAWDMELDTTYKRAIVLYKSRDLPYSFKVYLNKDKYEKIEDTIVIGDYAAYLSYDVIVEDLIPSYLHFLFLNIDQEDATFVYDKNLNLYEWRYGRA